MSPNPAKTVHRQIGARGRLSELLSADRGGNAKAARFPTVIAPPTASTSQASKSSPKNIRNGERIGCPKRKSRNSKTVKDSAELGVGFVGEVVEGCVTGEEGQ